MISEPIVNIGSREVIGSWKIIEILHPLMLRISFQITVPNQFLRTISSHPRFFPGGFQSSA